MLVAAIFQVFRHAWWVFTKWTYREEDTMKEPKEVKAKENRITLSASQKQIAPYGVGSSAEDAHFRSRPLFLRSALGL